MRGLPPPGKPPWRAARPRSPGSRPASGLRPSPDASPDPVPTRRPLPSTDDPMTSFDAIGYAPTAQGVRPVASTSRNAHASMTNPHLLLIDDDARLTRM